MAHRKKRAPIARAQAAPGGSRFPSRLVAGLVLAAGVGLGLLWFAARARTPPNLLLITIDTLRADHVGAYGYSLAQTPTLDGLARRGVRFERVTSAVPLTGPSHSTILTGLYPPVHGVRDNVTFALDPRHVTIATRLKRQGFRTAAFVAAYPVAADFGFSQGFDSFEEGFHEVPVAGQGAERPGNEVADSVVRFLEARGRQPFFVWAHFYDPHAPYRPPPPYDTTFKDHPYDGEIAFADAQVGRILEALRRTGREQDTIVAVLSDHGESLGEHGERTHAIFIYEATTRVPWVLAGPGVGTGRVVPARVGTVDVVPTLLGLLGQDVPADLPGRDLRPALRGERLPATPYYAESLFARLNCRWSALRGWTSDEWKLVVGTAPELYDLADDPTEASNRAADQPERLKRLQSALAAAMAKMAPSGDSARPVALAPEQEEKLRSLGYVGGGGGGGAGALDQPGLPDPRTHIHLYEKLQAVVAAPPSAIEPAIGDAVAVVSEDPENPFAHFTLASLAYRGGQLAVAERAFRRSLELDPDRSGTRQYYGTLLFEMGRFSESEKQLRIAFEQTAANDYKTRLALAETLIALNKFDEAQSLIDAVLAKAPAYLEGQRALGRLLVAKGQTREAIPHLERAAEGPDVDPLLELAEAYVAIGDAPKARATADKALERSPGHPWALAISGRALLLAGQREPGLAALRESLAARPRRTEVWLSLARGFDAAGDPARAQECRRQAESIRRS